MQPNLKRKAEEARQPFGTGVQKYEPKKKEQIVQKEATEEKQVITKELKKTASQLSFEIVQKRRMTEKINEKLQTTYKQKIEQFNKGLNNLPEHFDIPKVGPG